MRRWLLAWLVLAACGGGSPEPEGVGDAAWAEGRVADALTAWRRGGSSPRVLAKRAEAALAVGHLPEAADAWARLARADPARIGDAAAGLARTALAAERSGDELALRHAVIELREVAPSWPVGRLALRVALGDDLAAADVVRLVPVVLATSPGPRRTEVALVRLASAERLQGRCDLAVPVYIMVARRSPGDLDATRIEEWASCETQLGLEAMLTDQPAAARVWLEQAAGRAPDGAAGRRALVALGDLHLADGDPFAAMLAWQSVAAARAAPDTITALAVDRLRSQPYLPVAPDSLERP
jgi:hypothetical protein